MKKSMSHYSVYMEESNIILIQTDHLDLVAKNEKAKVLSYEGKNQILEEIDYLEANNGKQVILHHDDLSELWDSFCTHYSPISAAGGLVTNSHNKILFIYRRKMWDLPKGKMEKGESIEGTAVREVQEECGLKNIVLEDFLLKTYHTYRNRKGKRKLKTTYWYKMQSDDIPTPQVEEDIEVCDYLSLQEFMQEPREVYSTIWQVIDRYQLTSKS